MTIHISLDLETWGKRPGCDIRSIGAVVFDLVAQWIDVPCEDYMGNMFYAATHQPFYEIDEVPGVCGVDHFWNGFDGYVKYDLHRDPETVKWWDEQSEEAQAAFQNPVDLRVALERFTSWIINMYPGGWDGKVTPDIRIWANDPHFDVSILAEAYHAVGLSVPWHYRSPRSMKTATDLAGLTRDEYVTYGTAHNALDDAIAQAWTICKCYERLGLTG